MNDSLVLSFLSFPLFPILLLSNCHLTTVHIKSENEMKAVLIVVDINRRGECDAEVMNVVDNSVIISTIHI